MRAADLHLLAAPFDSADVEWKPGAVTRDKSKGLAMAYLTSRAVQDRLDAVCGPADWRNEYRPGPDGGVLCGISIYVERAADADGRPSVGEWITKWDGADNTDVEAVKGGLSGSMKRAAVMWGIGRDLYSLPAQWVRLDERGRFAEPPRLPGRPASRSAAPAPSRPEPSRPEPSRPSPSRPEPVEDAPRARADGPPARAERSGPPTGGPPAGAAPLQSGRRIIRPAVRPGEGDGGGSTRPPAPPF